MKLPSYQKFFLHVRNWGETALLPRFLPVNRKGIYFKWVRLKSGKTELKPSVQVRLPNMLACFAMIVATTRVEILFRVLLSIGALFRVVTPHSSVPLRITSRLVFSRFFYLRRNLKTAKEKPC